MKRSGEREREENKNDAIKFATRTTVCFNKNKKKIAVIPFLLDKYFPR